MEEKKLERPLLVEERKKEIDHRTGGDKKKKEQLLIPKEILEKLTLEEKLFLEEKIKLTNEEKKHDKPHQEHEKDHNLSHHLKDEKHPHKHKLDEFEKIELAIELCGSKEELIKILNDINKTLLESKKEHYDIKIRKRK